MPTEHGGWGFSLEPGLLGILVAPGVTSVGLAVFALFVFLADRPTRMVLGDVYRRRRLPRTNRAAGVAAAYGSVALGGLILAVATADRTFIWVMAAALPFVALQLSLEARGRMRSAVREMAGPIAIASIAASAAVADGQAVAVALGLWLILGLRVVMSVALVRAQIRRAKGKDPAGNVVAGVHAGGLAIAGGAALAGVASWPAFAAIAVLCVWAGIALRVRSVRANIVGVTQMTAGTVVVILTALGHPPA